MAKPVFNYQKWERYLSIDDMESTVQSLDNILYEAVMRLLDPEMGGTAERNQTDVSNVRFLLENLRECIKQ